MDFQYLKHRPELHHNGVVKTLSLTYNTHPQSAPVEKVPYNIFQNFPGLWQLKTYRRTNHCEDWLKWKMKRSKIKKKQVFFHHSMFSITVSGEQQEPKCYSKDTTFGAKQYTAYIQRLDSILAGCTRNLWKVSRFA